ncbi:MAG: lysozyme family protein [Planctomycetota bacterium]|jgi:hypothetical protein
MQRLGLALVCPPLCALVLYAGRTPFYTHAQILHAIHMVESGGRTEKVPTGDGGKSIGPLQISRAYWKDSGVPGRYEDCVHLGYSKRVVAAFMQRWQPAAWARHDAEVIARLHNGGPRGMRKQATIRYWEKVRKVLERPQR